MCVHLQERSISPGFTQNCGLHLPALTHNFCTGASPDLTGYDIHELNVNLAFGASFIRVASYALGCY